MSVQPSPTGIGLGQFYIGLIQLVRSGRAWSSLVLRGDDRYEALMLMLAGSTTLGSVLAAMLTRGRIFTPADQLATAFSGDSK